MTSRPRLKIGRHLLPGLAAVALFVVLAVAFLAANFPAPQGFGEGSVTASIGYAMFDLTQQAPIASEPFLAAFEIIDLVLVAALVGAVMLARREEGRATPLAAGDEEETDSPDAASERVAAADGGEEVHD